MQATSEALQNLVVKYDQRGPRYTSYPTAPYFQEPFSLEYWCQTLEHLKDSPLSLYFHIPYCKSLCWYCGCNMEVTRKASVVEAYLELLKLEIQKTRHLIGHPSPVHQIHFGGGSPNMLTPSQLVTLMQKVRATFEVQSGAEISIEADPRLMDEAFVHAMAESGFNRVSMGIQDFNPKVQKAIHRQQPFELVAEKLALLRSYGFHGVNMDVMYGLPYQTTASFFETLHQVTSLKPARLALFNYAHLPQLKPHMKLIPEASIPDSGTKLELFWLAKSHFETEGYEFIGMDHFALRDDPLCQARDRGQLHRNFQGYTTHAHLQMVGFGQTAISFLNQCYVQNYGDTETYATAIRQGLAPIRRGMKLSTDDIFRSKIIQKLFCYNEIRVEYIENLGGQPFGVLFPGAKQRLQAMEKDGLLVSDPGGWRATELGQILLRNIAMVFDAYLQSDMPGKKPLFSKTL